jgi:spore coat protein CotH
MDATLTYNSKTWTHVGVRWKGHASLIGALKGNVGKLSMSVKFDKNEAQYPELSNQRFYGFKGFSLGNAYKDPSYIRDKTAADIFRAAGVPAPRGSFTQVYMDIGKGPVYLGVYTVIEEEDEALKAQLGDNSGNLYKPWGDAARWTAIGATSAFGGDTTETDVESFFEKSNNETSDWSDVINAINVLHADRTTDEATWRANLEQVFDVHAFLKTLATNQTMQNWDSYGCMTHNYYVYANPNETTGTSPFVYLPWDLNESLTTRDSSTCAASSVMLDEVVNHTITSAREWPLIEYILGNATYRADYKKALQAVLDNAFVADTAKAQMQADHDLILPYLDGTIAQEAAIGAAGTLFSATKTYQSASLDQFKNSLNNAVPTNANTDTVGLFVQVDARRAAVTAALAAAQ